MPKFSVIVPVYNSELYLSKCIDSILSQTIEDFELILINDGSKDNSKNICERYAKNDSRILVIDKDNGGVSSARNIGLDNAKGEYICFVDSDDYIDKDYIEKLYIKNVDMVLCNMNYINLKLGSRYILHSKKIGRFNIDKYIIDELIESRYISTAYCKLYKRDIINKYNIRFDETISLGEDTMFVAEYITYIDKLYISDSPIYNYIDYGEDSLSKFNKDKLYLLEKSNQYIAEKLINIYPVYDSEAYKRRIWSNYEWAIFETINSNMNYIEKRRLLKYIFNNEIFINLVSDIDLYMIKHPKKVRSIISTKKIFLIMIFFKLSNIKNNIMFPLKGSNKIRGY